jgi:large subunit ribosomal protein L7Ae
MPTHLLQDQREFAKLAESFKASYNDGPRVNWGGHILGPKSQHKHKKRERAIARELAQRATVA